MGRVSPLQFLFLLQLRGGSKYGYEMLKTLREQFNGVWEPKTGTIYPALRSLEARGFVETEERGGREFYALTERGDTLLKRMGKRLEIGFKLTDRYCDFVMRWMPRSAKNEVMEMLNMLAIEDVWPPLFLEHFLDESMELSTRLEVLGNFRKLLGKRLKVIDEMIAELRDGGGN